MTLLTERHEPRSLVQPLSLTGRVCLVTGGAADSARRPHVLGGVSRA